MTRNSDLDLEDLRNCKHKHPIPIVDDFGHIVLWKCPCGYEMKPAAPPETAAMAKD
jgi:hypothetical protein